MPAASHIRLQYLPSDRARTWRNSSLTMWAAGRANMEATAAALMAQEGWHAWRIVEFTP
jgi:2-methylcitrate dehydratase PrpD